MDKKIYEHALFNGAKFGFFCICWTSFFYVLNSKNILPQPSFYTVSLLLFMILFSFIVTYIFKYSSFFSFKTYFSICFLFLAISLIILRVYYFLLYNYFDPHLISEYFEFYITNFDDYIIGDKNNFMKNFSFLKQLQAYVFSLIPCALYSALISLLVIKIK
tara:strand:- start:19492 stop:19974 length:483 start_codon:yes stop_codon:yes gene_type:complete